MAVNYIRRYESFSVPGTVVTCASGRERADHERACHEAIARTLAHLKGYDFGGEYDADRRYEGPLYCVPADTLLCADAQALGIRSRDELFGGVVPFHFVATKTIVHPLADTNATAPRGWSSRFVERVRDVVLPGFCAFTLRDAYRAGQKLLAQGPIRLKRGVGIGGSGQAVLADEAELRAALDTLDPAELERYGVAIEVDLEDVTTYSIGQVWVGDLVASYCGTQSTTANNCGHHVFGGSDLLVVRGGFEALDELPLPPEFRLALAQARAFDAATEEFAGFFASRRNYDAVRGRDRDGRWRAGILEQSWRIGGASGAEVAALAAFKADPDLRAVHARCSEVYGSVEVPAGAIVHFRGVDSAVGPITKYTVVEAYEAA